MLRARPFRYLFPYLIIPSSDPDISDIPTIGLTPISLRQHYRQGHYSSAPVHTARIPTRRLSLEGHWSEIRAHLAIGR
jgi:hypothetical protein